MPMYIPRQFREDRRVVLAQAVRDIQLATLVTPSPDGIQVTRLPVHLVPLHRGFDGLSVSRIERGQVGVVYLNSDAPSRAGLA